MGNPGGVSAGCESDVSSVEEVRLPHASLHCVLVNFKCQFDTTQNFGGTESQLRSYLHQTDQRACLQGVFLIDDPILGSTIPLGRRSQAVLES